MRCNHKHTENYSIIELTWDLFVLKLKLPVKFEFGERATELKRT